ncbi:hypothetical protein MesoLj131a_35010 [Mesorhizobium sp. 131-2-1]|nr:hypothetical protein MesoLj131a_35010 [Mesorhizobium sp. 131-2-1]
MATACSVAPMCLATATALDAIFGVFASGYVARDRDTIGFIIFASFARGRATGCRRFATSMEAVDGVRFDSPQMQPSVGPRNRLAREAHRTPRTLALDLSYRRGGAR